MKILNLKKCVAKLLVAAGLLTPAAAQAALLNTNLVTNPSFEDVETETIIGGYNALLVLDWEGGGGAYAYTQEYDNGDPPDGAGERYFSPNSHDSFITQDIDLSEGPSGSLIAAGTAEYSLSAFFSSYATDGDYGTATLEFLDAADKVLEDNFMEDSDTTMWTQELLTGTIPQGTTTVRITLEGVALAGGPDGYIDLVDFQVVGEAGAMLQPGDADQDLDFDQLDLVRVQVAAKYLTGQAATWGEGDWNGAPGGAPGSPPTGNGLFDQVDIIAALSANQYLKGPYYPAIAGGGSADDGQSSIGYNATTGELWVNPPAGLDLTSINIDSASGIFTGAPAQNLGGSFDNDTERNIFKATFGSSFGAISFGNAAQPGLSEAFVQNDLSVVGSLAGGGDLGAVDLIYVPEPGPATLLLLGCGLVALWSFAGRGRWRRES